MKNKYFFIKRQKAISEYIARFEGVKSKGGSTATLHDFALGVCLNNKQLAKGFLSRLNTQYPAISASVSESLSQRKKQRQSAHGRRATS